MKRDRRTDTLDWTNEQRISRADQQDRENEKQIQEIQIKNKGKQIIKYKLDKEDHPN